MLYLSTEGQNNVLAQPQSECCFPLTYGMLLGVPSRYTSSGKRARLAFLPPNPCGGRKREGRLILSYWNLLVWTNVWCEKRNTFCLYPKANRSEWLRNRKCSSIILKKKDWPLPSTSWFSFLTPGNRRVGEYQICRKETQWNDIIRGPFLQSYSASILSRPGTKGWIRNRDRKQIRWDTWALPEISEKLTLPENNMWQPTLAGYFREDTVFLPLASTFACHYGHVIIESGTHGVTVIHPTHMFLESWALF